MLAVKSQGTPQSHIAQQTSNKRFIQKGTGERVAVSTLMSSSRELSRRQALYRVSWGGEGSRSYPG